MKERMIDRYDLWDTIMTQADKTLNDPPLGWPRNMKYLILANRICKGMFEEEKKDED